MLTDTLDVDVLWSRFCVALDNAVDMFVPLKRCRTKDMSAHYPLYIRQLFKKKRAAWRLTKKFKNNLTLRKKYNEISTKCKDTVSSFVKRNEENLVNSNNLGRFYKYVNDRVGSKSSIGILKDGSGADITENQDKADAFNAFLVQSSPLIMVSNPTWID